MPTRLTIDEMRATAAAHGGKCLSLEYVSTQRKLLWECSKGHRWQARPAKIKIGRWCPECGESKPKSIDDMHRIAAGRGGKCLSDTYSGAHGKLKWQCAQGHRWEAVPANVQHGSWCPVCGRKKPPAYTLADIQNLAQQRSGKCLSERYTGAHAKHLWQCDKLHTWEATPTSVKRGSWCPVCGNERQGRAKAHSIELMRDVAAKRNGQCLSTEYRNNLTPLRWKCAKGHEWSAVPGSILGTKRQKGTWCPICAGKMPPGMMLREFAAIATSRGGRLLSTEVATVKEKLRWQCAKGHEWEAIPDSVKRGTWCPVCGGSQRLSLADLQEAAALYGGKCLATEYQNTGTSAVWQCAEGHQWEARGYHVRSGHWCPVCASGLSERICRALLEHITGVRWPKHRPTWLKNDRGNQMELDGFAPSLGMALEYQGHQHFRHVNLFHQGGSSLAQRQRDDAKKRELCRQHEVTLLEVPYSVEHAALQDYLTRLLDETVHGRGVVRNRSPVAISELGVRSVRHLQQMKDLAVSRGGKCLSDFYINNATRLTWQCREGHTWMAVPGSIQQGSWCPKCGTRSGAVLRAHDIRLMRQLAESHGGECLSEDYRSAKSRLTWRCAHGHTWETQASVIMGGHWCPKCVKIRIGHKFASTIEHMRQLAEKKGGQCLSSEYTNNHTKLRWRCAKGHEWDAVPNSVVQGHWCAVCAGVKKKTIEQMREIAAKHGGKCLSESYRSVFGNLLWQCANGHKWEAPAMGIIHWGAWCPVCAPRKPKET